VTPVEYYILKYSSGYYIRTISTSIRTDRQTAAYAVTGRGRGHADMVRTAARYS
jgi:hypothetical protein